MNLSIHLQSWPSHSSILHSMLFCCELTRMNPYIHPAAQPPLTFLTPQHAPLQAEALQIEPAWGQVAGRTQLKSSLVDLCGSQLLLALLLTFISSVPFICSHLIQTQVLPLSGNNSPSISPWSSYMFLCSEASVVCIDENLAKIRSLFPYLPIGTVRNSCFSTSCDDLTDFGWNYQSSLFTYEVLEQSHSLAILADFYHQHLWMCQ